MSSSTLVPDDWPDEELDEASGAQPDVHDRVGALEWADRRLVAYRQAERELYDLDQLYLRRLAELEGWHDRRRGVICRRIADLEQEVVSVHRALLALDPRCKTLDLPNGRVRSRTASKPTVTIADAGALAAWAREHHPELLPPRPDVRVTDLRRIVDVVQADDGMRVIVTATGEVVPAVEAHLPETTFTIDTDPDGAL